MTLPDGTQLVLNTDTAIDVRFDGAARLVVLHAGEIHVATAHDGAVPARPFLVRSSNGVVRALGTHFSVRQGGSVLAPRTQVAVSEGAVEIQPNEAPGALRRVDAGRQGSFDDDAVSALTPLAPHAAGWVQGVLIAERMPLGEVLAQVARYRYGVLRCDPALRRHARGRHLPVKRPGQHPALAAALLADPAGAPHALLDQCRGGLRLSAYARLRAKPTYACRVW